MLSRSNWRDPADKPAGLIVADVGQAYVEGYLDTVNGAQVLCFGLGAVCDWREVVRWSPMPPDAGSWDGRVLASRLH